MVKQRDTQLNNRSGIILAISQPPSLDQGDTPATDYQCLAEALDAVIVGNVGHLNKVPLFRKLEKATALDIGQAIYILQKYPNAEAYISFSERIGIPLGMLLGAKRNRPAHIIIAHRLDTRAKKWLNNIGRWSTGVDKIITLCTAQHKYAEQYLPSASVFIKAGSTDELFYSPDDDDPEDYVLSVGSENRDYETLLAAAQKTKLKIKILSSSPWCRKQMTAKHAMDNVDFLPRISYAELRELYQRARLTVVPLHDVEYAAGLNGVLEALCAGKPLIVTASKGIIDYVRHGSNAFIVPPNDADALAEAMITVYKDTVLQEELRSGARSTVEEYANLQAFTCELVSEIRKAIEDRAV